MLVVNMQKGKCCGVKVIVAYYKRNISEP